VVALEHVEESERRRRPLSAMPASEEGVRNRRRKEARPDEILDAAMAEFAEYGYAAARLDRVAQRAGIAKGTIYLYFPSKEELFKAAALRTIVPQVSAIAAMTQTFAGSTEEFIRGPFKQVQLHILRSEIRYLARIILTEGRSFPDLTEFFYQQVVQRGLDTLRGVVARGVASGEFRHSGLEEYPHSLMSAAILAVLWESLLERHGMQLDVERLIDTHLDSLLEGLKARPSARARRD
jgi:AcrR family transcriptional regulator